MPHSLLAWEEFHRGGPDVTALRYLPACSASQHRLMQSEKQKLDLAGWLVTQHAAGVLWPQSQEDRPSVPPACDCDAQGMLPPGGRCRCPPASPAALQGAV